MTLADREPRIFISYSRRDGSGAFAEDLRKQFAARDLDVWQDVDALRGGRDWWSQIVEALNSHSAEHFVLIVTPAALESKVIRQEIRLARQAGCEISPVRGPGLGDSTNLPRWIGEVYDLDNPDRRNRLLQVLTGPSRQRRVPMMAPEPPEDFVQRPREFEALKTLLLDSRGDSVAITAALRGAGGYGKTTLAMKLAHDADIKDACFDGVLWVELGENPSDAELLAILSDLINLLTGAVPGLETVHGASSALAEALGDLHILLVIDDVWRVQDLRPFLLGGGATTRLITTRIDSVLPASAAREPVDAMEHCEALELLGWGLPEEAVATHTEVLAVLAARLGDWALLLKLVNGFIRDRVVRGGEALAPALEGVARRLDARGLIAFDSRDEAERSKAVALTIGASLGLLGETGAARFAELAVFPEDTDIPIGIVAGYWEETGGLAELDAEDLLERLDDLALLLDRDLGHQTIRLHDIVRHFLRDQAGEVELAALHGRLAQVLKAVAIEDADRDGEQGDMAERRYACTHLAAHLAEAGALHDLCGLLLNPGYLKAKLQATGTVIGLISDYFLYGTTETHRHIGRTLKLISGICMRDPRQMLPQLYGRLMGLDVPETATFVEAVRAHMRGPLLVPIQTSMNAPAGAEAARLDEFGCGIVGLTVLPDGRLAVALRDYTIRLWDLQSGFETARLEGHESDICALALLSDGRLASCSRSLHAFGGKTLDNSIRCWDVQSGAETSRTEIHGPVIETMDVLPDGRLALGARDGTIRLWDLESGDETGCLRGPESEVYALALLPDGRLASGFRDSTIIIWDMERCAEVCRLEGHEAMINTLASVATEILASGSNDGTIRLWDLGSGTEIARLGEGGGQVYALAVMGDGRLAAGQNASVCIWDLDDGARVARLEGHLYSVAALAALPGGDLVSGSTDGTVRLWEIGGNPEDVPSASNHDSFDSFTLLTLPDGRLAGLDWLGMTVLVWNPVTGSKTAEIWADWENSLTALAVTPDGRLATGSDDGSLRFWNAAKGNELVRLDGQDTGVSALAVLPDGRLATGSMEYSDHLIRLWDPKSGAESARLYGHDGAVCVLAVLPDGRLVSGSFDETIRVWDVKGNAEMACLEGHNAIVEALAVLPDGHLASGSVDFTIRLWDLATGTETARLEGHEDRISSLSVMPDGRLISASEDRTVRLWDVGSGKEIMRFEFDGNVTSVAAVAHGRIAASDNFGLHWLDFLAKGERVSDLNRFAPPKRGIAGLLDRVFGWR